MKKTCFFLISIFLLSCNQNTKNIQEQKSETKSDKTAEAHKRQNFDWLTGHWKRLHEKAGKETFENWQKISPREYSGIGFTLQEGDTINQEKMALIRNDGKWTLSVRTPGEKKATTFQMTDLKSKEFVCVNDSVVFPTKIHYWLEDSKMKAEVSNSEMKIPFEFEKMK